MKDRVSMMFVQYGQIDVLDGVFVVTDKTGVRTHIPVGSIACLMLEPGTRVSHAVIKLASMVGTDIAFPTCEVMNRFLLYFIGLSLTKLQRAALYPISCNMLIIHHFLQICYKINYYICVNLFLSFC